MEALNFIISENAARRIQDLLLKEQDASMMRITVNGGGCSGFKYDFTFVNNIEKGDHIFSTNDAKVVIDNLSLENFMNGAKLDYIENLTGASFTITNPNSSARCGCGNSFAI